jgi:hypothetical protein
VVCDEARWKVDIGGSWLVVLDLISQECLHDHCTCMAPRRRQHHHHCAPTQNSARRFQNRCCI